MAHNIIGVRNGVTIKEAVDGIEYIFPMATLIANNEAMTVILIRKNGYQAKEINLFEDYSEKFGTSTPTEFCEYLIDNNYFKNEKSDLFSSSVTGLYQNKVSVHKFMLCERQRYPSPRVLHDICQFTLQRPKGTGDNYRLYTPSQATYGIEIVSTSSFDSDAVPDVDAGVKTVAVDYLDENWNEVTVEVALDGTSPVVAVPSGVRRINDFHSLQTGQWSVARGDISLRTTLASSIELPWTGQQILGFIEAGGNKDLTAIFTVPANKSVYITSIVESSSNGDQSIRITSNTDPTGRNLIQRNCFLFQSLILLGSQANNSVPVDYLKFPSTADIKISCLPRNTNAYSSAQLYFILIDN